MRDGRQQAQFATCRSVLRSHGVAAVVPGVWTTRLPPWSWCVSLVQALATNNDSRNVDNNDCAVLSMVIWRPVVVESGHAMFDRRLYHI